MAFDLLLQREIDVNWARGAAAPLPLSFSSPERKNLLLLEPSTRAFAVGLIAWAREHGIAARLSETWRSEADQKEAIAQGKSGITPGKIGWHQVGRAFHLVILRPDKKLDLEAYRRVGLEARARGGEWLGDKPIKTSKGIIIDTAHFEFHPGLSIGPYRKSPLAAKELSEALKRSRQYA
jgi:hypothetical protein